MSSSEIFDVLIIGGGYTGAALAIHLSRMARRPLSIGVIEPRQQVGCGVAYSCVHPDHRLNGPASVHVVLPEEPNDFRNWFLSEGLSQNDPGALTENGRIFARRADFGRYMVHLFKTYKEKNNSGTQIIHIRKRAEEIKPGPEVSTIILGDGSQLIGRLAALTVSIERPIIPTPFKKDFREHPRFIPNPWDLERIGTLKPNKPILILGSALTAVDVIAALARQGHEAPIHSISRRGLLPMDQNPGPELETMWVRFMRSPPKFMAKHGKPHKLKHILRCLRKDIKALQIEGKTWHGAFDDLRDSARTIWPSLPLEEQRRFIRHLKPWYETRRFRIAPQIRAILDQEKNAGRLRISAARVVVARPQPKHEISVALNRRGTDKLEVDNYGAVINCTGPGANPAESGNPLLLGILAHGIATPTPNGQGFLVDKQCRSISSAGEPQDVLRVIGPLTRGCFLESGSVPSITYQIYKILPNLLETLDAA